jgi:hypothetical protein
MESNGPETKVRGPAAVIYERYLQLARDATSSGDRVLGENYLQHADHYFRLVRSMQPAQPVQQQQHQDRYNDGDHDGDDEGAPEGDRSERTEGAEASAEGEEQPDVEFPQGDRQQFDRGEGGGRRRRRNRFRSGEGGEGAEAREGGSEERPRREPREGGDDRPRRERAEGEDRAEREPRRERAPREPRDGDRESGGREGFSDGPKPAFLRSSE